MFKRLHFSRLANSLSYFDGLGDTRPLDRVCAKVKTDRLRACRDFSAVYHVYKINSVNFSKGHHSHNYYHTLKSVHRVVALCVQPSIQMLLAIEPILETSGEGHSGIKYIKQRLPNLRGSSLLSSLYYGEFLTRVDRVMSGTTATVKIMAAR